MRPGRKTANAISHVFVESLTASSSNPLTLFTCYNGFAALLVHIWHTLLLSCSKTLHRETMMKITKLLAANIFALLLFSACSGDNQNHTTAVTTTTPPAHQKLQVVARPAKLGSMMAQRGEQDASAPVVKILSPANDATVKGSVVHVRLSLSGDLKGGFKLGKEPGTDMGNHVHVILDNQPYEAYYDLSRPFELRNVSPGKHTLRVFPSRPWHESFKNNGAFEMVSFTVVADPSGPPNANATPTGSPATGEGKDMTHSTAGDVDPLKPLLTYSRPKGENKGADAEAIMIDFWLTNAKLKGDGGEYRVRYIIDDDEPGYIDKWEPIWLTGWTSGPHTVRLELLDKNNNPVENGGYNTTTREITVVK
jgi:hypothetical protein